MAFEDSEIDVFNNTENPSDDIHSGLPLMQNRRFYQQASDDEDNFRNNAGVNEGSRDALGELLYRRLKMGNDAFLDNAKGIFSVLIAAAACSADLDPRNHFQDSPARLLFSEIGLAAFFLMYAYSASKVLDSLTAELPLQTAASVNENYINDRRRTKARTLISSAISVGLSAWSASVADEPVSIKALIGVSHIVLNYYAIDKMLTESQFFINLINRSPFARSYRQLMDSFDSVIRRVTYQHLDRKTVPGYAHGNAQPGLSELSQDVVSLEIFAEQPLSAYQVISTRLLPALFATGLSTGLIMNSVEQLINPENNQADLPLLNTLPPAFSLLAIREAANSLMRIADIKNQEKPAAYLLYPMATLLASLLAGGVSLAGFSTLVDMIRNEPIFKTHDPLSDTKKHMLILAASSALVLVGSINQKAIFELIPTFARYCGSKNEKELAIFQKNMEGFRRDVRQVSPKKFSSSLDKLSSNERIRLLPMHQVDMSADELLSNLNSNQPLLSTQEGGDGYQAIETLPDANQGVVSSVLQKFRDCVPSWSTFSMRFNTHQSGNQGSYLVPGFDTASEDGYGSESSKTSINDY
ncbi:MAG: hypothetical protein H0U71_05910 [Gammaproteobacteria bacterium]|nr:hypothetical protein [Gammaproteobacteria bacterium]